MESGAKERGGPAPANRALAHALEHPLRARIAAGLEKRSTSPQQLADALDEPLSLVAYHCNVLAAAGSVGGANFLGSGGLRCRRPPAGS